MPSPESESASALPQPEVVEKKGKKKRFVTIPTHIRGVSLRIEPDGKLDPKRITEELYPLAREYAARYFQINELGSEQKKSDQEIKEMTAVNEDLRGIQSEEDDFVLTIIPKESVGWDHQLLKESLGIAYSALVHEDLRITISVPAGFQTKKGLVGEEKLKQVLTMALTKLGLSEDDLKKIMEAKVEQRIDRKTLEEMIAAGKVSLLAGTKQRMRTWAITVDHLRKSLKD